MNLISNPAFVGKWLVVRVVSSVCPQRTRHGLTARKCSPFHAPVGGAHRDGPMSAFPPVRSTVRGATSANWTFAGRDAGGYRAPATYSSSRPACSTASIQSWLAYVIAKLPDHPAKRIDKLRVLASASLLLRSTGRSVAYAAFRPEMQV